MTFSGVTLEFSGVSLEFLPVKSWTFSRVTLENDRSSMKVKMQVGELGVNSPLPPNSAPYFGVTKENFKVSLDFFRSYIGKTGDSGVTLEIINEVQ
jgi:hypothetical protein